MQGLLLVATQVALEHKSFLAHLTLEGTFVIVHPQVVQEVAHLFKLGSAAAVLANQQLLAAVRVRVDAHQLVVLGEALHRLDLDVSVLCRVLIQELHILTVSGATLLRVGFLGGAARDDVFRRGARLRDQLHRGLGARLLGYGGAILLGVAGGGQHPHCGRHRCTLEGEAGVTREETSSYLFQEVLCRLQAEESVDLLFALSDEIWAFRAATLAFLRQRDGPWELNLDFKFHEVEGSLGADDLRAN